MPFTEFQTPISAIAYRGPLLLKWVNFSPSMNEIYYEMWDEIPNFIPHICKRGHDLFVRHCLWADWGHEHYEYVTMDAMASQITSLTIVYSTVYSGADQRKHQIHRGPVNSPHKWPVTRKMFLFDDVIMRLVEDRVSIIEPIVSRGCFSHKIYLPDQTIARPWQSTALWFSLTTLTMCR